MSDIENPLSAREMEILRLVATGATNAQIALALDISPNTVKVHLKNIFAKLEVLSRTEAATLAIKNGWVQVGEVAPGAGAVTPPPLPPPMPALARADATRPWPPVARWQKALLLTTMLVLAVILWLPPARTASPDAADPFSDRAPAAEAALASSEVTRWTGVAQMPTPRGRLAVVALDGLVYAIGGDTANGVSDAVEIYDPATNTWRYGAAKPTAAANIAAVAVGGKIYVPGGFGTARAALATLEVYDSGSDLWTNATPLPEPLFAYALAAVGERIYLFGGSNGVRYLATTYIYDTVTGEWSRGTPLAAPRAFLAASAIDDVIYVVGGYDGVREYARCDAYDPALEGSAGGPWRARADMLAARAGMATAVVAENLYVIGGGWSSHLYFNERYDPANDVWATIETPILGQWRTLGVAAVPWEREIAIYALGGWNGDYLSVNQRYRPFFYVSLPSIPSGR